jgi:CheY-like chemotaxis protein
MCPPFSVCLLIDDCPLDNLINLKLIKKDNFASEVVVIELPEDALSRLRDGRVTPDIIFLDIRMPQMSAFKFLKEYDRLNIDKSHTQIFILTSSIDPKDKRLAEADKHISGYLMKALTPEMLFKIAS